MIGRFPKKDPTDVLDYGLEWAGFLSSASPADTLLTSDWDVDDGITLDSEGIVGTQTVLWLSEGTHGIEYNLVNTITTVGGRTMQRTVVILVEDQ